MSPTWAHPTQKFDWLQGRVLHCDQIRKQAKAAVGPAKVPHTAAVYLILARADGVRTHAAGVFEGGPLAAIFSSQVAK